jgi:periplasmic divalent cation tolerance protein
MSAVLVFCTCPDEAVAERIATALVEERLAACVNRLPGLASTYHWQGKICNGREVLLLIKTTGERFDALRERILALHPYDVPEVIALAASAGSAAYLDWIESSVRVDERGA